MRFLRSRKRILIVPVLIVFLVAAGAASIALANCGPFTDVGSLVCPFALDIYFLGVTAGTTSTTYSPNNSVTRGQMAIFMGALYNQIKRTENSYRFLTGQGSYPFSGSDRLATTANTNAPDGFATDGYYDYVANQGNNKIDIFVRGAGYPASFASYTTATPNNRLACDGFNLYATEVYGTNVKSINLATGVVNDTLSTVPTGASDIIVGQDWLAVTTDSGVSFVPKGGGAPTNVAIAGGAAGVAYDGQNYWVSTWGGHLLNMDYCACNIYHDVTLPTTPGYYLAYDGQIVWVPESDGTIAVVATRGAQTASVVDVIPPALSCTTTIEGLAFTGVDMMVFEHGTSVGCSDGLVIRNVATHQFEQGTGTFGFGTTDMYTIGWDGMQTWVLGYDGNFAYVE